MLSPPSTRMTTAIRLTVLPAARGDHVTAGLQAGWGREAPQAPPGTQQPQLGEQSRTRPGLACPGVACTPRLHPHRTIPCHFHLLASNMSRAPGKAPHRWGPPTTASSPTTVSPGVCACALKLLSTHLPVWARSSHLVGTLKGADCVAPLRVIRDSPRSAPAAVSPMA